MEHRETLVALAVIGGALIGAFVLAWVIHVVLLSTDQFNWLEGPRHSP